MELVGVKEGNEALVAGINLDAVVCSLVTFLTGCLIANQSGNVGIIPLQHA